MQLLNTEKNIEYSSLKLIHSYLQNNKPINIYKKFRIPNRSCSDLSLNEIPVYKNSKTLYYNKYLKHYNNLPSIIRNLADRKRFKFHCKYYLMHNKINVKLKQNLVPGCQ